MNNQVKRDEFKNYLDQGGAVDQLTKCLVGLYEEKEKPSSAVDFMKKYLGSPTEIEVDSLKQE